MSRPASGEVGAQHIRSFLMSTWFRRETVCPKGMDMRMFEQVDLPAASLQRSNSYGNEQKGIEQVADAGFRSRL